MIRILPFSLSLVGFEAPELFWPFRLVLSEFWYLLWVIMLCRMFFSGWSRMMYSFGVKRHAMVTVADRLKKEDCFESL